MINYSKLDKLSILWGLLLLLGGCISGKRLHLYTTTEKWQEYEALPKYQEDKVLYSCQINGGYLLKKYTFTGLLFIKKMEDATIRVVFQSEMGITFFDMEWGSNNDFKLWSIIDKMNHPALIKTLRKDFEVLLRLPNSNEGEKYFRQGNWYRRSLEKGFALYRTSSDSLNDIYIVNPKMKKVVSFTTSQPFVSMPDNLMIQHHNAGFEIKLIRLEQ